MLETFITAAIGTLVGVGVGGAVTAKVITAVTAADMRHLTERVDKHERRFERVVHKDHCDSCGKGDAERLLRLDERHTEVIRRLGNLETSFRSCFDDLVHALRADKMQREPGE